MYDEDINADVAVGVAAELDTGVAAEVDADEKAAGIDA